MTASVLGELMTVDLLLVGVVFVEGLLLGWGIRARKARLDRARYWKAIDGYLSPIEDTMEQAATELSRAYEALCRDYLGPVESPYLTLDVRRGEPAKRFYDVAWCIRHTHSWARHTVRPIYNPTLPEYTPLPGRLEDMDQATRRREPTWAGDPRHWTSASAEAFTRVLAYGFVLPIRVVTMDAQGAVHAERYWHYFEDDLRVTREDTLHAPPHAEMTYSQYMLLIDAEGQAAVNRVLDCGAMGSSLPEGEAGEMAGRLESQLTLLPERA
jgi:hypothetical protein